MVVELYKHEEGVNLVVVGNFTKEEIQELKREGYRRTEPQVNKNGIPVRGV